VILILTHKFAQKLALVAEELSLYRTWCAIEYVSKVMGPLGGKPLFSMAKCAQPPFVQGAGYLRRSQNGIVHDNLCQSYEP